MSTNNPKVSAYVPKLIKERLTQFREEQDVSESQAVTIILAEYFGLNEALGRSPEESGVGGVTLARMEALEEKVANLAEAIQSQFQELTKVVVATKEISGSPVVYSEVLETNPVVDTSSGNLPPVPSEEFLESDVGRQEGGLNDELPLRRETNTQESSPSSESQTELPIHPETQQVDKVSGNEESVDSDSTKEVNRAIEASEADSSLPLDYPETILSENSTPEDASSSSGSSNESLGDAQDILSHPQSELPFELQSEPLIEFPPITSFMLSKRFDKGEQSVKQMKYAYKNDIEKFVKWSQGKDPDKIAWKYVSTSKRYVPTGELTSEQRSSLLKWYKENSK